MICEYQSVVVESPVTCTTSPSLLLIPAAATTNLASALPLPIFACSKKNEPAAYPEPPDVISADVT